MPRTFPTELHVLSTCLGCYRLHMHPERPHIDASMYAGGRWIVHCLRISGSRPACDEAEGLRNMILSMRRIDQRGPEGRSRGELLMEPEFKP